MLRNPNLNRPASSEPSQNTVLKTTPVSLYHLNHCYAFITLAQKQQTRRTQTNQGYSGLFVKPQQTPQYDDDGEGTATGNTIAQSSRDQRRP
jgi:hypothetical protein